VIALGFVLVAGCVRTNPGAITKSFIFDAALHFQGGDHDGALISIQKAMAASRTDVLDRASAAELYDDSGLYYFFVNDIEESRHCQSIAVLLGRSAQTPVVLRDFYLSNLDRIYTKLGKSDYLPLIHHDATVLLRERAIWEDPYVQRYVLTPTGVDLIAP
jgi:hypothetical protein